MTPTIIRRAANNVWVDITVSISPRPHSVLLVERGQKLPLTRSIKQQKFTATYDPDLEIPVSFRFFYGLNKNTALELGHQSIVLETKDFLEKTVSIVTAVYAELKELFTGEGGVQADAWLDLEVKVDDAERVVVFGSIQGDKVFDDKKPFSLEAQL